MLYSSPKARVLAFDPGFTTGIALLSEGTPILGIVASAEALKQTSFLTSLTNIARPTTVLIESPPQAARFNQEFLHELFWYITKWYTLAGYKVDPIKPAQWKGFVKRSENLGKHIQDATDMAIWFSKKGQQE